MNHWIVNKKSLMQSVATFFLLFYAFTNGLTGSIYGNINLVWMSFIVSVLIMFYYYGRKLRNNLTAWLILAMLGVMYYNNQNFSHGYYASFYFSVAVFLFYFFSWKTNIWHKAVIYLAGFAGVFYAFMTVFLMFTPNLYHNYVIPLFEAYGYGDSMWEMYQQGYMPGFTPHYSTNGIYLAVGLAVPVAYLISGSRKFSMKFLFALILFALLLTGKRGHVVFGIASILICYYFMNCNKPVNRWFKIVSMVALGALVLVIVAEFVPSVLNVVYRFIETSESGDIGLGRDVFRALALELFAQNKMFGIGWDGFRYYYNTVFGYEINVHCVYVQLLCESGIIGSLIYYTFFVIALYHIIYAVKYLISKGIELTNLQRVSITFSLYVQCFFLLYCITGNPLYDSQILIPYIMACAIGEYYYQKVKRMKVGEKLA